MASNPSFALSLLLSVYLLHSPMSCLPQFPPFDFCFFFFLYPPASLSLSTFLVSIRVVWRLLQIVYDRYTLILRFSLVHFLVVLHSPSLAISSCFPPLISSFVPSKFVVDACSDLFLSSFPLVVGPVKLSTCCTDFFFFVSRRYYILGMSFYDILHDPFSWFLFSPHSKISLYLVPYYSTTSLRL